MCRPHQHLPLSGTHRLLGSEMVLYVYLHLPVYTDFTLRYCNTLLAYDRIQLEGFHLFYAPATCVVMICK